MPRFPLSTEDLLTEWPIGAISDPPIPLGIGAWENGLSEKAMLELQSIEAGYVGGYKIEWVVEKFNARLQGVEGRIESVFQTLSEVTELMKKATADMLEARALRNGFSGKG